MNPRAITCANCWKRVEVVGKNAKYCPACTQIVRAEQRRIRDAERRAQLKKAGGATKAKKKPRKSIAQINAEARKMGMTYGQYVSEMDKQ